LESGLAAAGDLRWAVADLTEVVESLRQRRDLSPVAAVTLGQLMAGAVLLWRLQLKTPRRLRLEVKGDGPLGRVIAEVDWDGSVRGMVDVPQGTTEVETEIDVSRALGKGILQVSRELESGHHESQVPLQEGVGVSHQLSFYLEQSEQTASAVLLGVLVQPQGVTAAGGFLVEALPGADEDLVASLETHLASLGSVSRVLAAEGLNGLVGKALGEMERELLEERILLLSCSCDPERYLAHLRALPAEDLDYILTDQATEDAGLGTRSQGLGEPALVVVDCAFCGERYSFSPEDLRRPPD
jgi:molecular chaperone Hsp33